jgi:hypothetical protein
VRILGRDGICSLLRSAPLKGGEIEEMIEVDRLFCFRLLLQRTARRGRKRMREREERGVRECEIKKEGRLSRGNRKRRRETECHRSGLTTPLPSLLSPLKMVAWCQSKPKTYLCVCVYVSLGVARR